MEYVKLGNIAEFRYGKMPDKDKFLNDGYPVFSGYRITGYYSEYMVENPTLIVVARGVGGTGDVKISPPKSYITNLSIIVDLDESVADMRYLYYQFVCNNLRYLDTGAAQSQITINNLSKHKALLPRLVIQKKISSILTTYDNLIENNNKRIKLLEQMAESLYKEWFVRFRFPGYEKIEFEEGLPKNWEYIQLKDIDVFFDRGISYSSEEIKCEDGFNLINLKNIQSHGGFRRDGIKKYNGKYKDSQVVYTGNIVMGITDMTQDRRIVGSVALIPDIPDISVISADLVKINSKLPNIFLYCMCRFGFYSKYFSQFANGANVLHLKPNDLLNKKILLPKEETITLFCKKVEQIIKMIDKLNNQNDILIKQRDYLLPRLMSGKLEV